MPFLRGEAPAEWRRFAISEYDYSMLPVAAKLGIEPRDARLFMVARQALEVRARRRLPADAVRPATAIPNEFRDLGADPAYEAERQRLAAALAEWGLRLSQRTTRSEQQMRGCARQVAARAAS